MELQLTEEQLLIQRSARRFLTENCPPALVRSAKQNPKDGTGKLWQGMADLGWMGFAIPEEFGGSGLGFTGLLVLLEEMGRVCLPGPFFSTSVLATFCLLDIANEQQQRKFLPEIAGGELVLTAALQEDGSEFNEQATQLEARPASGGYVLKGNKLFVPDADMADYLMCSARIVDQDQTDDGLTLFILPRTSPGLALMPLENISGVALYEVEFDNVEVTSDDVIGEAGCAWPCLEHVMYKVAVAKCAEMVGSGDAVLDLVTAHARERVQFGSPIGSFQAIQHHCVNMLMDLESARWLVYKSACQIDGKILTTDQAAMTKAWCNQALRRIVQLGHQVMGGIGYCEEHVLPLYFRNARLAEIMLGDSDTHRETVATALLGTSSSADNITLKEALSN